MTPESTPTFPSWITEPEYGENGTYLEPLAAIHLLVVGYQLDDEPILYIGNGGNSPKIQ